MPAADIGNIEPKKQSPQASQKQREPVLKTLESLKDERFVIVFRGLPNLSTRRDFRALYALRGTRWVRVAFLFPSPGEITETMVAGYGVF